MNLTASPPELAALIRRNPPTRRSTIPLLLTGLWIVIFFVSAFTPPVLDDADGTHANAARQMALSGDLVTLRVNNVRYLEKAPLPYWIVAASLRLFGFNAFGAHLPQAIGVLLLMLLGMRWAGEAFGERAGLYTGLGVLTSAGVFLFTRIFIPDLLLSLLLCAALYCFLRSLDVHETAGARYAGRYAHALWIALALAILTKGLVALVFIVGTAIVYLAITGESRRWRQLRPISGALLMVLIAAPWHILAGLRNTGGMNGHGFFWFYFINEHVLRFLGRRTPMDYNKLPGYLYWSLHLVWLFPWALFVPLVAPTWKRSLPDMRFANLSLGQRTALLLGLFSGFVLIFFSLSTNQEYYTFPAYLPLLMLISVALARSELRYASDPASQRWINFGHASFAVLGAGVALGLGYGLWTSRNVAPIADIGELLAHRGVGDYTLSMSSLFDLTGPSFAALRLPAALALTAFAIGPAIAWMLRRQRRHVAATFAIALTSAMFLVAAHLALVRFAPMLSSQDFAAKIQQLEATGAISRENTLLLYGDQAYGSSIPFYLNRPLDRPALLVDGRSSSMLFGSTFADAQGLFLTPSEMMARWGSGERKLLFVPLEQRDTVDRLLGGRGILIQQTAGKALLTDRALHH